MTKLFLSFRQCRVLAFLLLFLSTAQAETGAPAGKEQDPPRDYLILINYELGMHCTGFDFAYCCVLPPYNSILAQVVKTGKDAEKSTLLGADPDDCAGAISGERGDSPQSQFGLFVFF